jgi:MSHA pilin protein MshC
MGLGRRHRSAAHGFTLVELVVVIVLVGVVSALVVPRLAGTHEFDQIALLQQTRAALRHAQKSAVAYRRQVCVQFTQTTLTLRVAADFGAACTRDLPGPGGETPYVVVARGRAAYADIPPAFAFDALGAIIPDATQTIVLQEDGGSVVVEAGTGYVH